MPYPAWRPQISKTLAPLPNSSRLFFSHLFPTKIHPQNPFLPLILHISLSLQVRPKTLLALFMWLSLHPSKPTLSIEKFYAPALNKTAISNLSAINTTVTFDLKLRNENKDKGVYYDALNITLYYGPNHSVVGNLTLDSFYQGHKKTAHRIQGLKAEGRAFWENATKAVSEQNSTVFRVGLWTAVRYKIVGVKTKRHRFRLVADIKVNEEGAWPGKKGVKFHSRAAAQAGYRARLGVPLAVLVLLVVW